MALACLAEIQPLDPLTGERVPIRATNANDRRITHLGDVAWEPAITAGPVLAMRLWNGDFQAAVTPGGASLPLAMEAIKTSHPHADRLVWGAAPVILRVGKIGQPWPWGVAYRGTVRSYGRKGQTLTLASEVDTEPFAAEVLSRRYAGTGGAEGGADLKSRVKPLCLGWPRNVEPVLIDAVENVYQLSGYGPIEAVTGLFERGSAFGAAADDHASYAALVAATIPNGGWATCLAEGLVRLGAPAFGLITADLKGHKVGSATPRLTGEIILALAAVAGVDPELIEVASLGALDARCPWPIDLVLDGSTSFFDIARSLALPCNHQAGVSLLGRFFAAAVTLDASPDMTLDASGRSAPQVKDSDESDVSPPYWRTVLGANRAWRVHGADEIAFQAPLVERGLYDDAEIYRDGNIVDLPDGSRWLYINAAASAGNDPPTWPTASNAWWSNLAPPLTADNLTYADGTPIEDLKPAEPAADVTLTAQIVFDNTRSVTVNADYTGAIISGLPVVLTPIVTKGGLDQRTDDLTTYAVTNLTGGCIGNVSVQNTTGHTDKGRQTITTGLTESGTYDLVITYNGTVQPAIRVTVSKIPATAPSGGSSGGTKGGLFDPTGQGAGSTGLVEIGRVSGLVKATGETIRAYLDAYYECFASNNATRTMNGQYQYSVAGAESWSAFAATVSGSAAQWVQSDYDSSNGGSITISQNATPADGTYDIRLVVAESSVANSSFLSIVYGTASVAIAV